MTKITEKQNQPAMLDRLCASGWYFERATFWLGVQFIITVAAAAGLIVVGSIYPQFRYATVTVSIALSLADVLLLERWKDTARKKGAMIQELFDNALFGIPWNNDLVGKEPDRVDIREKAQKYAKKASAAESKKNWYPKEIEDLEFERARLLCQRYNSWWEDKNKKAYLIFLQVALVVLLMFAIGVALYKNMKAQGWVLMILVPLSPAILWLLREIRRHSDAVRALDDCAKRQDEEWQVAIESKLSPEELTARMRGLQDAVFLRRKANPLIFVWFNGLFRKVRKKEADDAIRVRIDHAT